MLDKTALNEKVTNALNSNEIDESIIKMIKQKRGRKSNKELELLKRYNDSKKQDKNVVLKTAKKRGRKPKGGKLIKPNIENNEENENVQTNIILHLKCNSSDLEDNVDFISQISYNPNIEQIKAFNHFDINNIEQPQFYTIEVEQHKTIENTNIIVKEDEPNKENDNDISMKIIWKKLKELRHKFNNNSISDKKSSCFWCTCDFDWPPTHIPKAYIKNSYEVYGCFCMPECAAGYLFAENLDSSTKWERYSILNNLYVDIYNFQDNIKPAPDPRYLLNKFYGDLSSEEYRMLIRKGKHRMLVVSKPLTHVLPELVEDSVDNNSNTTGKKFKLTRNKPSYNKLKTNQKSWAF